MMSVKPSVWLRMSWVSSPKQELPPLQTQPSQRLRWHQLVIKGRRLFLLHALHTVMTAFLVSEKRIQACWKVRDIQMRL